MSACRIRRNMAGSGTTQPNNPALSAENNKKFEEMLAERAKQDALLFGPVRTEDATGPIKGPEKK